MSAICDSDEDNSIVYPHELQDAKGPETEAFGVHSAVKEAKCSVSKEVGKVQPRKTGNMPEAGGVNVYSQILLRPIGLPRYEG